jgi:hypothetical protein
MVFFIPFEKMYNYSVPIQVAFQHKGFIDACFVRFKLLKDFKVRCLPHNHFCRTVIHIASLTYSKLMIYLFSSL